MTFKSAQETNPAGRGWYRLKSGKCERAKPCPKGTFRIGNSDTLYEFTDGPGRRAIYFKRVTRRIKGYVNRTTTVID